MNRIRLILAAILFLTAIWNGISANKADFVLDNKLHESKIPVSWDNLTKDQLIELHRSMDNYNRLANHAIQEDRDTKYAHVLNAIVMLLAAAAIVAVEYHDHKSNKKRTIIGGKA